MKLTTMQLFTVKLRKANTHANCRLVEVRSGSLSSQSRPFVHSAKSVASISGRPHMRLWGRGIAFPLAFSAQKG